MVMEHTLSDVEKVRSLTTYDEAGKAIKYKRFDVLSWHQCPKHGPQPATYGEILGSIKDEWAYPFKCLDCEKAAIIERTIVSAGVPPRYLAKSLDAFDTGTPERKKSWLAVKEFADTLDQSLLSGRCLIMIGGVGTGKTHLACGLVRKVVENGKSAKFTTVQKLIREVRASWGTANEQSVINAITSLDLLVIDEVGVQAGSENEKNILFDIINSRYEEMRSTVIITNCDLDGIRSYLGERVVDRLRENSGRLIQFAGKSYRG